MKNPKIIGLILSVVAASTSMAVDPWIIDPHTHFKGEEQIAHEAKTVDREPENTLGQVVVPEDYRELADRLKIQSTLIVEAVEQDKPQFNDWVFRQAESDLVCGYVARGDLASDEFRTHHERYQSTGLLNGYRFRFEELAGYLEDPTAQENLALLEADGLVVDLLVDPEQADSVVKLAQKYPKLTIVINHCFRAKVRQGKLSDVWKTAVVRCAKFPNVCCKLSSFLSFAEAKPFIESAPSDLAYYRPILEHCFSAFGEDRVIFATNWGVCTHFGSVDDVVRIADEYFSSKGESIRRKAMRDNAIRVYNIAPAHLRSFPDSQ